MWWVDTVKSLIDEGQTERAVEVVYNALLDDNLVRAVHRCDDLVAQVVMLGYPPRRLDTVMGLVYLLGAERARLLLTCARGRHG